jgi:hypothetical protein
MIFHERDRGFCRSIKVVFFHQSFLGQLEAQRNQSEDRVENIEVIMASKIIKLRKEGAQSYEMGTFCDIEVNCIILDLIVNLIFRVDFPELTGFITCIRPDLLDTGGIYLQFIRRDVIKRNTSYVKETFEHERREQGVPEPGYNRD